MSAVPDARIARLSAGVGQLGLSLDVAVLERLLAYADLLQKWNRVYNLSAIRADEDVITHHLLDSLAILPHLPVAARLADIGSGAGLPGLVLAIADPALQLSSVETVGKKTSFQQQVKIELGLPNVTIFHRRVEQLTAEQLPGGPVQVLVSRAFASLVDFIHWSGHLLAEDGLVYAMKGQDASAELEQLPPGWALKNELL
ncbi:MAG: 16S rRNA (guanine(527)-N(7))-methyltransferase RsmG, partial [Thauera sp.]|nr:16S rRNA (guanine(527)-N(7))-methyltransferase RsmG [Thauera sp.]